MSAEVDELRPTPAAETRGRRRIAALVALVAFGVHAHTLGMGLVWDDVHHVQQNEMIRSLANVPRMFVTDQWSGGTRDTTATPYYRPLYKVSLALDHALWGERPAGYHLTNTLLHALASALVALVAWTLVGSPAGALVAGIVFAVHPVHSEAVAWISARNELVCAVFLLVSLQAYLSWHARGRGRDLALALAAFFASLLGKEISITLPALVLLHQAAFGKRPGSRALAIPGALGALALAYVAIRSMVLVVPDWGGAAIHERVLTSFGIVARYLRLLVFPLDLSLFHQVPAQTTLLSRGVVVPMLVVASTTALAVVAWRRDRRVGFALAWVLVTLAPVSGIPAELFPARMAERYLYTPSIGFALLAGVLVTLARARAQGAPTTGGSSVASRRGAVTAVAIALLATRTFLRDRVWTDQASFTSAWVREVPNDPVARVALGVIEATQGRVDDAEREYLLALRIDPGFVDAHANLGVLYDRTGRPSLAARHYRTALALDPRNPEVLYDVGVHHLQLGQLDEAARLFEQVIAANPASADAHFNLGLLAPSPAVALEHLEAAVRLDDADPRYRAALESARRAAVP